MPEATPPPIAQLPAWRPEAVRALAGETFDVLVVGGGITGTGVARDAAMRGLRVALVEREDFASGTSSRSSRLVHGGIRYLEHGQLRLVFESSRERRTLLRIAPHLVRPLAFTWPVYEGARVPRWKLAAAMLLYDTLALYRNVGRHHRLGAGAVHASEPALTMRGLRGGARYWDAATDDARLTLATVMAARDAGAIVINHAAVTSLLRVNGAVCGATVLDALGNETFEVRARVVVSATGPWSDALGGTTEHAARAGVRGSKGAHVCVPRDRVRNAGAVTLLHPCDGRVMFVLPAGDFTIIGTTDTFDDESPEEVRATPADVQYLLDAANHYFPDARLSSADVVAAWAGIRPLAAGAPSEKSPDDPGAASREHAIGQPEPGFVRVTGGKLTTYRAMAEEVVDVVERALGHDITKAATASTRLPGGTLDDLAREVEAARVVCGDADVARRLVHAHGSAWREVWSRAERQPALRDRIEPGRPYVIAELRHAVERELACTLGDLLMRRTPVVFETRDHGAAAAKRVLPMVARWLGWSDAQATHALAEYLAETARMFGS